MKLRFVSTLCGYGLCLTAGGLAQADDADAGAPSAAIVTRTSTARALGALTWTLHADDWRGRLVGEHLVPLRASGALRPLGRATVPQLRSDAFPGWSLEADPHRDRLTLNYRVSF